MERFRSRFEAVTISSDSHQEGPLHEIAFISSPGNRGDIDRRSTGLGAERSYETAGR
jgi:hypothetical protein